MRAPSPGRSRPWWPSCAILEHRLHERARRIRAIAELLGIPDDVTDLLTVASTRCEAAGHGDAQWRARDQEVATCTRMAKDAAQRSEHAELDARRAQEALEAWRSARGACFLPSAIEPADLESFLQALGRARLELREIDRQHTQRALVEGRHARAEALAAQLAAAAGVAHATAPATSKALEAALEAARSRDGTRRRALAARAEAKQRSAERERAIAETKQACASLLASVGASSVAEARELIARSAQRSVLSVRVADLQRARRLALGGATDPALLVLLRTGDPASWRAELASAPDRGGGASAPAG